MNAKDDGKTKRRTTVVGGEPEAEPETAGEGRQPGAAELESQDDLAYVTGQRDPKEDDKQVRSPGARRQGAKGKGPAEGDQQ